MSENEKPDDDKANGVAVTTFEEAPTDMGDAVAAEAAAIEDTASLPPEPPSPPPAPAAPPDPLAEARAETAELKDKYLRMAADFDNYRKRARRDVEDAEKRGKETLLRDLLPIFDNLERAASHATAATDIKAVTDGVRMVLRQFSDTLERVGITRIATAGVAFDPNVHEAIQQLETLEQAPGTVVTEVQAGYALGERLIRAAMVVVAKAPALEWHVSSGSISARPTPAWQSWRAASSRRPEPSGRSR